MNSIISISNLDLLDNNSLVLLDDEHNGICLALKSNETFNTINFKFKELKLANTKFGIILLKLDDTFHSCYICLSDEREKNALKHLFKLNNFNLVVFNDSKCHKVYSIPNKLENILLMNLPIVSENILADAKKEIINFSKLYSPEFLWNN